MPGRWHAISTRLAACPIIRCGAGSNPMRETMRSRFELLWRRSRRRLPDSTALGVFRKMRAEGRKGKALSLLQRIRTPFADGAADEAARLRPRVRSVSDVLRERREEL